MDGVNADSVGRGAILRDPPYLGCADGVRVKPQPEISIRDRSRLGRRGMRPAVGDVRRQAVDASGDSYILNRMADRILGGENLLPVSPREFAVCNCWFIVDFVYRTGNRISKKHNKLFNEKR